MVVNRDQARRRDLVRWVTLPVTETVGGAFPRDSLRRRIWRRRQSE
jgi:hypothetical protein